MKAEDLMLDPETLQDIDEAFDEWVGARVGSWLPGQGEVTD
jgi:hypothetical protein